ncbi:MAG: hypothetical protein KH828_11270 [Clostridiales bacterium]|nr:hypothetical protein [Clostridiales bacterium]
MESIEIIYEKKMNDYKGMFHYIYHKHILWFDVIYFIVLIYSIAYNALMICELIAGYQLAPEFLACGKRLICVSIVMFVVRAISFRQFMRKIWKVLTNAEVKIASIRLYPDYLEIKGSLKEQKGNGQIEYSKMSRICIKRSGIILIFAEGMFFVPRKYLTSGEWKCLRRWLKVRDDKEKK